MPKLDNFFNQTKNPGLEKNGTKKMHPQNINYKKLQESSYQYRQFEPGDVEKLADLIQTDGEVLQPLLVRKAGGDTYEILAGHKRHAACKYLVEQRKLDKFAFIPCYIKDMTDVQAEFAVYSTNGYNKKSDYEIMKEIQGMERLLKEHPEEFPEAPAGRMAERLAAIMEKSKTTIQEYLTISKKLGASGMEKFKTGEISKDSAKVLSSVPEKKQNEIITKGITKAKEIKQYIKAEDNTEEKIKEAEQPKTKPRLEEAEDREEVKEVQENEKLETDDTTDVVQDDIDASFPPEVFEQFNEDVETDVNRPANAVTYENPVYIDKTQVDFIKTMGRCPYCDEKIAYPINRYFCGYCGKSVNWYTDRVTLEELAKLPFN